MARHTGMSVSATLGRHISFLNYMYTQNNQASITLGNQAHWNRVLPQGVWRSHTQKVNIYHRNSPLTYQLRMNVMTRYPDYQVYSEDPAPTKLTSLGLVHCQQAQIASDANLPMSPSQGLILSTGIYS